MPPSRFPVALVIRVVRQLDQRISQVRQAQRARTKNCSPHTELSTALSTSFSASMSTSSDTWPSLSLRPDGSSDASAPGLDACNSTELSVLLALANVYGEVLLENTSMGFVSDLIAQEGGARLVQRVLWGNEDDDARLRVIFDEVCTRFEALTFAWPEAFMADADRALAAFRPSSSNDEAGDSPSDPEPESDDASDK